MLYQAIINVANFVGACIIQGVHSLETKWAWRTSLFVMMSAPLTMLALVPLLPETPSMFSHFCYLFFSFFFSFLTHDTQDGMSLRIGTKMPKSLLSSCADPRGRWTSWSRRSMTLSPCTRSSATSRVRPSTATASVPQMLAAPASLFWLR